MLTYEDILNSVTRKISKYFNCDVFVDSMDGTFENECFYVSIIPVSSKSTLKTSEENLIISIKYFGGNSKIENYQIANKLKTIFNINIQVNDRSLNISNIEPNFLTDEVGHMLDFLITIRYFDEIVFIKENEIEDIATENMQSINLNMKG